MLTRRKRYFLLLTISRADDQQVAKTLWSGFRWFKKKLCFCLMLIAAAPQTNQTKTNPDHSRASNSPDK